MKVGHSYISTINEIEGVCIYSDNYVARIKQENGNVIGVQKKCQFWWKENNEERKKPLA